MRKRRWFGAGVAGVTVAGSLAVGLVATATPDSGFNGTGQAVQGEASNLSAVAWPDGRITAVGVNKGNAGQIVVVEYAANGASSVSYVNGPGGNLSNPRGAVISGDAVIAQFAAGDKLVLARIRNGSATWVKGDGIGACGTTDVNDIGDLAVAPNGTIFSVGWNFLGNTDGCDGATIRRYDGNGNRSGATRYDNRIEAMGIATDGSGNAYATGVVFDRFTGTGQEMVGVTKVDANGNAAAWGNGGLATIDVGTVPEYFGNSVAGFSRSFAARSGADIAIDSQGRILLVGGGRRAGGGNGTVDTWVARLNANGSPDGSFGNGGVTSFDVGGDDWGLRIAVDSNDQPIVAGLANGSDYVVRLNSAGIRETTSTANAGGTSVPNSVAIGFGKVVTAGTNGSSGYVSVKLVNGSAAPGIPVGGGSASGLFTGVTPWRAIDTRDENAPLQALQTRSVKVGGLGGSSAPTSGTVAVALNVTVVDPTAGGYLSVFPGNVANAPTASTLNFSAGQTIANSIIVGMAPDGSVNLSLGAGTAHVVVDLMGWFGAGQGLTPAEPYRWVDTRTGNGGLLAPGEKRTFQVANPGATAAALNLTAVDPTDGGHLRAWPAGAAEPNASVINFGPQQTIANALVLGVDGNGGITVGNYGNAAVHVVIDGMGSFTGTAFHPVTPVRAADTRSSGPFPPYGQFPVKVTGLPGVPDDGSVKGVIVNITVVEPTAAGFFSAFPSGGPVPLASLLNFTPQITIANATVMGVGTNGSIDLLNSLGHTHAVVDVLGWF